MYNLMSFDSCLHSKTTAATGMDLFAQPKKVSCYLLQPNLSLPATGKPYVQVTSCHYRLVCIC